MHIISVKQKLYLCCKWFFVKMKIEESHTKNMNIEQCEKMLKTRIRVVCKNASQDCN